MEEHIFIQGFCNDLYNKLQNEGIYVSCSNWEGISNSLIEALAIGIPTIATDCPVGGSRMFIKNRENGILIKVNDKQGLVQAMNDIADHAELEQQLSKSAMKIREKLSVEKIGGMWLEL